MVALALGKSLFEQGSQRVGRPEPKKPTNLCDLRPRNEKRPAVDLSTPGVKSFGRQSSNSDESFPIATLLEQKRDSRALKSEKPWKNGLFSFCPSIQPSGRPRVSICRLE
jgi:hypothetical protein